MIIQSGKPKSLTCVCNISADSTTMIIQSGKPKSLTRVFVTYAFESKRHLKEVLALCRYLRDEAGFVVALDDLAPPSSKLRPDEINEKQNKSIVRYKKVRNR